MELLKVTCRVAAAEVAVGSHINTASPLLILAFWARGPPGTAVLVCVSPAYTRLMNPVVFGENVLEVNLLLTLVHIFPHLNEHG